MAPNSWRPLRGVNMLVFKDMATGEGFDEQTATEYPNRAAYLLALSDPRVAAVSPFRADGLVTHWIYTAGEADMDLGF